MCKVVLYPIWIFCSINSKINLILPNVRILMPIQNIFGISLCSDTNLMNQDFQANWLGVKNSGKLTLVGFVCPNTSIIGINSTFLKFNKTRCTSSVNPSSKFIYYYKLSQSHFLWILFPAIQSMAPCSGDSQTPCLGSSCIFQQNSLL